MTATIVGFPRIGENRELKFITEKYFKHEVTEEELKNGPKIFVSMIASCFWTAV